MTPVMGKLPTNFMFQLIIDKKNKTLNNNATGVNDPVTLKPIHSVCCYIIYPEPSSHTFLLHMHAYHDASLNTNECGNRSLRS